MNYNNEKELEHLAVNSNDAKIRAKAVEELKNQNILQNIVFNCEYNDTRFKAIQKISDENILIQIAIKSTLPKLQKHSIYQIKNEENLIKIAIESKATEYIKTVELIDFDSDNDSFNYFQKRAYYYVGIDAINKIKNQKSFHFIVQNIMKITINKDSLKKEISGYNGLNIDEEFNPYAIKLRAIEKLNSLRMLNKMYKNSNHEIIKKRIIQSINSIYISKRMFFLGLIGFKKTQKKFDSHTIKLAIEKLKNQYILAKILLNENDYELKKIALNNITNKKVLKKIALKIERRMIGDFTVNNRKIIYSVINKIDIQDLENVALFTHGLTQKKAIERLQKEGYSTIKIELVNELKNNIYK